MIKVKLKPEQGIKVRLTPSQSAEVSLKTVYLYDPDWIPEINKAVADAKESADNAKVSEQNAAQSASDADADATNAAESATIAYNSEQNAIAQANKATEEANAAAESAYQAQTSALAAHEYASNAEADAQNALETLGHVLEAETNATNAAATATEQAGIATEKATEAGTHATNAGVSATNAKTSEDNAKNYELGAKGYSETATQEANASAESAYQSQQSALASAQYASDAESDAQNALETLGHVLESETISTNAANTATQKAQEASESAADAQESAEEAQRIKDSLGTVYEFKGSVATFEDLPTNASVGDVYDVLDTGKNYAWDGSRWDDIGGTVDLSAYAKTTYVDGREQAIREDYMKADTDLQTQITGQATAITEAQGDIVDLQNNKQGVISDLDTIRSGAGKGSTAVQPATLNDYATTQALTDGLATKQPFGDYATKTELNTKQDVISDLLEIRSGSQLGASAVQPIRKINNKPLSSDITLTNTDVGALSTDTKYGSSLSLSINEQTYILTAQLKDQNGENLGTAQTVDLPLETMVVGAEYDEDTKEIVLTLKNGESIRFSIADLVSGLQPTISDLDTIRSGAEKGATAVQPSTLNDYAKKTDIPVVPTKVSAFENDAGYLTEHQDISNLATKQELAGKQDTISDLTTIRSNASKGATAVQPSDLSAVATSGSYNDLTNKPTIPTVNNGVLTIQKNGIQVATFSANQSGNVTANIEADTQVNADWNATSGVAQILNKPTLSTVSTSGSYNDLTNKPTIPSATSQLTNDSDFTTKNYVDTTEQEIIENYMQADTDLQTQITGLSTALTTAQGNITTINSKIPTSASSSNQLITNTELTNATQDVRSDFADADSDLQTQITGLAGTVATNQADIVNLKAQKYGADLSYSDDKLQLLDQDGNAIGTAVEITGGGSSNDKLDIDLGNATSTTKETVVGWGKPDYDTVIKIGLMNNGDSYVAPKDGFVLLTAYGNTYCTYALNSKSVQVTSYSWVCCIVYPVAKGTTITKTGGTAANGEKLYNAFVPSKGV